MPVQDFVLNPAGDHRLQVHWSAPKDPAAVTPGANVQQEKATLMINRSIFGTLDTPEDWASGKDFSMADGALLHVQFFDGKPFAWINGQPLVQVAGLAEMKETVSINPANRKRSGRMTAWMIIGIVFASYYLILYFLNFLASLLRGSGVVPAFVWLLLILLACVGIAGYSFLLAWKKLGFYLVAAYVVLDILISIPFGFGFQTILPLIYLAIVYYRLQRTSVWDYLT